MSEKYQLKYWFEWHTNTAFWCANDAAYKKFSFGPVSPEKLPLTQETMAQVHHLSQWYDGYIDFSGQPYLPMRWRQDECDRFNLASKQLYETVVAELGSDFEVIYHQKDAHEDLHLDEYLKDPEGFKQRRGIPPDLGPSYGELFRQYRLFEQNLYERARQITADSNRPVEDVLLYSLELFIR
ncbi:MAG: hypothetical protein ACYDBJ_11370 [Aggregatilineales bacterium]